MRSVEVKNLKVECWILNWMAEATGKVKGQKGEGVRERIKKNRKFL